MATKKEIGAFGEDIAADFLVRRGYEILDRRYQTRGGEVDIIARKGPTIVFVEVKARTGADFGLPEEAITWRKREKLLATARWYLAEKGVEIEDYRIDSIAVEINRPAKRVKIRHRQNITYPGGGE
jgi:putative endonuclease